MSRVAFWTEPAIEPSERSDVSELHGRSVSNITGDQGPTSLSAFRTSKRLTVTTWMAYFSGRRRRTRSRPMSAPPEAHRPAKPLLSRLSVAAAGAFLTGGLFAPVDRAASFLRLRANPEATLQRCHPRERSTIGS